MRSPTSRADLRRSRAGLLAAWLVVGCQSRPAEPVDPQPARSARPRATSAAPAASAAAPGGLCDRLVTPADIKDACGAEVIPATSAGPDDLDGPAASCSRRFTAGGRSLSLVLTRFPDASKARAAFDGQTGARKEEPEYKVLPGLGGGARRFVRITLAGDLNTSLEALKGPHQLLLFTPKVASNDVEIEPMCSFDQLGGLARIALSRLP